MSDSTKGIDSSKQENPKTDESGKELDADELESVAGGLLPAVDIGADKWVKVDVAHKIEDSVIPPNPILPAQKI
jgi:hypothetical protein